MTFVEILLIAFGLAMDAGAVSLAAGAGARTRGWRAAFRLSFHFGLFQFLMPLIGWFAGGAVSGMIEDYDHWIAFALLAWVGGRMLRSGLSDEPDGGGGDPSRGRTLVMLSVATSIDALAVGLSLAMLRVTIWYPAAVIGVVTVLVSLAALHLGSRLGRRFGRRMEAVGGLVLLAIGARILAEHLGG